MAIDILKSYKQQLFIILISYMMPTYNGLLYAALPDIKQHTIASTRPFANFANHKQQTPSPRLKITTVGDIMLGGTAEPVLNEMSYHHPFQNTAHLFKDSHIVMGNLEGPLTNSDTPFADKTYLFKSPPEKVAPALKQAGFTIMNLANNHIMDFGIQGLKDTMQALTSNQISHVGAGINLSYARKGKIIQALGQKIGFLSYSLTFPESFWANKDRPGTAFGHEQQIREDVRRIKQQADIVIVSFHWGKEKTTKLKDYQPILAHAAIDEGAAMVTGHHPHVLQAVEHYKNGIILYSLGNFTFGSYSKSAEFSVIASVEFKQNQPYSLILTPINVYNIDVNFQPQTFHLKEANKIIKHINQLSLPYNTQLKNLNGTAVLQNISNSRHINANID